MEDVHHADIVDLTIPNDDDDDESKPVIYEKIDDIPTKPLSHHKPPSSAATNNAGASAAAATAKPRSTKGKQQRSSPSPSPPPQPQLAPLQTIRLEIKLGGPENYAIDVADVARATGQRPPTPVRTAAPGVSDSEEEEDVKVVEAGISAVEKPKKRKQKKNPAYEHYDTSDPFIDDSELAIDERTFFAQTKQTGFYVSSGEVALLKDKTPKKPKSKTLLHPSGLGSEVWRKGLATGTGKSKGPLSVGGPPKSGKKDGRQLDLPSGANAEGIGTAGLEDDLKHTDGDDESVHASTSAAGGESLANGNGLGLHTETRGDVSDTARTGEKRKRYLTIMEGGKKRKVVDVHSFDPLIQEEVENLRAAISKENWDQKGKFPPSLKPNLSQLAVLAIKLDEYDDHFFNLMPTLFPYNKFTMSKLIKRTVFPEHTALLMERQDALLKELADQAKVGFSKAEEEWEKSVIAWDKRQEKLRLEGGTVGGTDSAAPTRHPTEEMDVDTPGDGHKDKDKDKDKEQQPPAKKYRLTESMKAIVWQLVLLSNECCRLENEKNTLEGSVIQVSEQGLRKALYQKIVAAFPEGWLSSGQISRDVSSMKKRYEKEAMEQENEQDF